MVPEGPDDSLPAVSGSATKEQAVHRGLELLARLARQEEVRRLRGRLTWGDLQTMRRDDA